MAKRGALPDGEGTRVVLLDAAESVFATEGIRAGSLRAIQRLANLAPGSLQYHFPTKEILIEALLAREHSGIREKQLYLAKCLLKEKEAPFARSSINVIAEPYLEFLQAEPVRGVSYVKVIVEAIRWAKKSEAIAIVGNLGGVLYKSMKRTYPDVTSTEWASAIAMASRAMLFLFTIELDRVGSKRKTIDAVKVETILAFAAAGLEATLAGLRPRRRRRNGSARATKVGGPATIVERGLAS